MRLLFITTANPSKQGDLLELSILHGLREVLGENVIDYPKKKVMYHDFSDTTKNSLHGRGFSLLTYPISDIDGEIRKNIFKTKFDAILYGDGHMYGEPYDMPEINALANNNVWFLDGHDLYGNAPRKILYDNEEVIGVQFQKSFKRELLEELPNVYPTGFGIPEHRIRKIDYSIKDQLFQKTAPDSALCLPVNDLGGGFKHHKFDDEELYYNDLSRSWFGLTCKRGGWDCLRHYEIIAAGALLLFKDYNKKPELCSPRNLPCYSYSSKEELDQLMQKLIINNKPTLEYVSMLNLQRQWLLDHGTTKARAIKIIERLVNE